jgi:hypothetical protein
VDDASDRESWPDLLTVNTFDELGTFARELVGPTAVVEVGALANGAPYVEITPHRSGARAVNIIADQWIVFQSRVQAVVDGSWTMTRRARHSRKTRCRRSQTAASRSVWRVGGRS